MATLTRKRIVDKSVNVSAPYGNLLSFLFTMALSAAGVYTDSDKKTAVGIGDVIRVGILPAGFRIQNAIIAISAAFTATSKFKIGFAYVDGVDSATVPQSDTYFSTLLDAPTVGRSGITTGTSRPVTLPKDAYLIITNTVAAQATAGVIDITVDGVWLGSNL